MAKEHQQPDTSPSFFKRILTKAQEDQPEPTTLQEHMSAMAHKQIEKVSFVEPTRKFWNDLESLREWWVILLPFLAWVGWRTYRTERRKVLAERGM